MIHAEHGTWHQWIVIAGKENDWPGPLALMELCVKALPPLVVRRGSIKDVSSHENGVDVSMFREVENSPDDIKARPRHAQLLFRRQPREPPAEVPVRRVKDC
jgi:hypothetical protein